MGKKPIVAVVLLLGAAAYLVWLATRPPTIVDEGIVYDEDETRAGKAATLAAAGKRSSAQVSIDLDWLLRELMSHDALRRFEAYNKAVRQPALPAHEPLVRLLLRWLDSTDATRHRQAFGLMSRMGDRVLPQLAALHDSPNRRVRTRALSALFTLRKQGKDVDGPSALELLKDPDKCMRDYAMRLVAHGVPYDAALANQLIAWLRPKGAASYYGAEVALARMGPKGVAHLVAILEDPSQDELMLTVLGGLSGAAPEDLVLVLPTIAEYIRSEDEATAEAAINVLIALRGDCEACLPALRHAMQDESFLVVVAALRIMRQMGPRATPALREVLALLDYGDVRVANAASDALAAMKADAKAVIPALGRAIQSEHSVPAAQALAVYGSAGLEELLRQFDAGDEYVQGAVLAGISTLGPEASPAVSRLVRLIEGDDDTLRTAAIHATARIGPRAAPAVSAILQQAYAGHVPDYRAAHALVWIGEAAHDPLREGLRSSSAAVRSMAVRVVMSMEGRTGFALEELGALLGDADEDIRLHAVTAIASAHVGYHDGGMPHIEADASLREPVRELLVRASKDKDPDVCHVAASALRALATDKEGS